MEEEHEKMDELRHQKAKRDGPSVPSDETRYWWTRLDWQVVMWFIIQAGTMALTFMGGDEPSNWPEAARKWVGVPLNGLVGVKLYYEVKNTMLRKYEDK